MKMRFKFLVLLSALLCFFALPVQAAKPIKAVIITGQNNHNWPVSHVALQKILENSGIFMVDVAISPKSGEDMSSFNVDFSKYDVVVMDYNGDSWNSHMKAEFVSYVEKGGGVVFYHAADNSFTDWKEYNEMIALGGWGGRTEKDGPYVYLKDGKLFKDYTPGRGGNHGYRWDYPLNCYNKKHPITKGLPETWIHASDELYEKMRGPGNITDLLYTAYADPAQRGSGRIEPLIFTVEYGKGRCFHTMLGHAGNNLEDNAPMQSVGFQVTLLRGTEWAATGKVKQKVPACFTGEKALNKDYGRLE